MEGIGTVGIKTRGAPPPCAKANLSSQPKVALAHCQRCVKGTSNDLMSFMCMGKIAYLRGEYEKACDYYMRAAAAGLLRFLTTSQQNRLRKLSACSPTQAREYAIASVLEHEPTLTYHLGHACYALGPCDPQYRLHVARYTKGLRGFAPEAHDVDPNVLLHFHDQGVVALRHRIDLLLTVFEDYLRKAEKQHNALV